jgi:Rieske Fe-S protein
MPGTTDTPAQLQASVPDKSRRKFLLLIPYGILAGITATIAAAAFRFLRPMSAEAATPPWTDVAPIASLTGDKPLMRSILVEHKAGWSSRLEEHLVYVLPQHNKQVLTAACPHEGCNVSWREDQNRFACPCHDSYFAPDGARITGPARRGLDTLPSREANGILQVQYRSFDNNTAERVVRG